MLEKPCAILAALPAPERESLLLRGVSRTLARGEPLFLTGDRTARLHVVTAGVLKLAACDPHGNESILGLAVPGDLVGEIAALDHAEHPFDAVAVTPCELIGVDAQTLLEMVCSSPQASHEMLRVLAARNRRMCTTVFERNSSHVPARLAGRLLDLAEIVGRTDEETIELQLPIAQHDLGRLAGMCRESACKTLTHFKRSGIVDYRGRRLRILRPDVLEKIRCGGRAARLSR